MTTTLTRRGQITIPKRIRDALALVPGTTMEFSVSVAGEVVLHPTRRNSGSHRVLKDRFDAVRGKADVSWDTDALMKLLRPLA